MLKRALLPILLSIAAGSASAGPAAADVAR
jgi:hypothetical protein